MMAIVVGDGVTSAVARAIITTPLLYAPVFNILAHSCSRMICHQTLSYEESHHQLSYIDDDCDRVIPSCCE